jgi:hypothetical protein
LLRHHTPHLALIALSLIIKEYIFLDCSVIMRHRAPSHVIMRHHASSRAIMRHRAPHLALIALSLIIKGYIFS